MPHGSMLKYFGDRGGEEHGGPLSWPGVRGFPFRGDVVPDLKQQEMEQLPLALDYKSRSFKLWDDKDKADFDQVMDRIVNGWYMQHKRYDNYVPEQQEYVVRLEWVQIYGEHPASKTPGNGSNAKNETVTVRPGPLQGSLLSAQPQRGRVVQQPNEGQRRQIGEPGPMGTTGTPY